MTQVVQSITTQYFGPANVKGARVKATASAGSLTVGWDHEFNHEQNHMMVARALADKYGWKGTWYQGGRPDDSGYCFVCVIDQPAFVIK